MDSQKNCSRFVVAQFCDDIRQEVGNKFSYIGCYSGEMIVDKLPATLPKLGVLVHIFTSKECPFSRLIVRALMSDEVVAELEMPITKMADEFERKAAATELDRIAAQAMLLLSPLVVVEPCKIRIEVETEDGVIRGSYLNIRERTPEDSLLKNH